MVFLQNICPSREMYLEGFHKRQIFFYCDWEKTNRKFVAPLKFQFLGRTDNKSCHQRMCFITSFEIFSQYFSHNFKIQIPIFVEQWQYRLFSEFQNQIKVFLIILKSKFQFWSRSDNKSWDWTCHQNVLNHQPTLKYSLKYFFSHF